MQAEIFFHNYGKILKEVKTLVGVMIKSTHSHLWCDALDL